MARAVLTLLTLTVTLGVGCGDGSPAGNLASDMGGGGDLNPGGYPLWNPSNPAICGQSAYTWQPASQVGHTLESAKQLSLAAWELDFLSGVAFLGSQLNVHHALAYDVQTAVIRYQTQDHGQLTDATAMVAWPTNAGKSLPTILFLHPTLGYTDHCAPSRSGKDLTAPMTLFALIAASVGYAAVFPDYLDQKSLGAPSTSVTPYLLMEPTALASLDALRAARGYLSSSASISASSDVYLWGHSQGGQAAEFVLALQPLYAPEFTFKAAATLSPPSDFAATAVANLAGTAPLYPLGEALTYAWQQYYGGAPLTSALLPPWSGTALSEMQQYCDSTYKDPIRAVTDPTTVFTADFMNLLSKQTPFPPWDCWLHYNNPATMDPPLNKAVPVLWVTGEKDDTVYTSANVAPFHKWCGQGVQIQHLQCSGADHTGTLVDSIDNVLSFFDDRRQGKPLPANTCQLQPAVKCASTP